MRNKTHHRILATFVVAVGLSAFAGQVGCGDTEEPNIQRQNAFGQIAPQGGTITSVQPTSGGGLTGGATGGVASLGLLTSCSTNQVLAWSGSLWACATPSSGITNGASSGYITQSDGTNLVASPIFNTGTQVNFTENASYWTNYAEFDGTLVAQGSFQSNNGATFAAGLAAGGQRITSVATPTSSTDAANRAYVDTSSLTQPTVATSLSSSTTNNFSPSGQGTYLWFDFTVVTPSTATVTGIAAPTSNLIGSTIGFVNLTAHSVAFTNQDSGSSSGNRLFTIGGVTQTIAPNQGILFWYTGGGSGSWMELYQTTGIIAGTVGSDLRLTGTNVSGASSSIDDGTTKTLSGLAWTSCSDSSTGIATVTATAGCTYLNLTGASQVLVVGITAPAGIRHLTIANHSSTTALVYYENTNATTTNRIDGDIQGSGWPVVVGQTFTADYDTTSNRWITNLVTDLGKTAINGDLSGTGNSSFTGGQTKVGNLNLATLSPSAISGTTNDWSPTGWSAAATTIIEVSMSAGATLDGLIPINTGAFVELCNVSASYPLVIANEASGSTAANRFSNGNIFNITLNPHASPGVECATYHYATAVARWILDGTSASTLGSLTLTSGLNVNSSGITANSITITAGPSNFSGHVLTSGTAITTGNLSCGASPSVDSGSTDSAGAITVGAVGTTSCALTFNTTYTNPPFCVCSSDAVTSGGVFTGCSATATVLTATLAASVTAAQKWTYICIGH